MRRTLVLALAMVMMLVLAAPATAGGKGATQVSGIGYPSDHVECDDAEGVGSDFPILITGDLEGCLYQTFGPGVMRPSGTYFETGTEIFVGCLGGTTDCGTFETTYAFSGKFADSDFGKEIFGRCQHPIVAGEGSGVFEGVTGRLDFKDVLTHDADGFVIDAEFPMRGHLRGLNGA